MRDVAVVGGGHNGLVCAAYLSRAGLDVVVLEANDSAGGFIWTEQLESGFRLELGAVDLSMIGDVADELGLADFGLSLLPRACLVGAAFGDGSRLTFHSDLDVTLEAMRAIPAGDTAAYREFAGLSQRALAAFDALPGVPGFGEMIRVLESLVPGLDLGRLLVSSSDSVVAERIADKKLASAIAMYGAHGQLPPWLPGTGLFSMLLPGAHGDTIYRPQGGSVALVDSIAAAIDAAGGSTLTGARVVGIDRRDGGTELRLDGGEAVAARHVVSSLDVRRTAALLADPPADLRRAAAAVHSAALNVAELKIDLGLSEPATITGDEWDTALWLLQEHPDSLRMSFGEIVAGRLPTSPAMMWAAPSALDPTAAPPGGGTVWLSAFVPARLAGRQWDENVEEEVAERTLDGFAKIIGTDVRPLAVERRVTGPVGWQRRSGSPFGQPNHIDLTIDQLFGWRPPGVSGYRTSLPWLYLTGAGTFPGGGVSGIPGRNAAEAVLADLGMKPPRAQRWRREVRGLRDAWSLYRSMRRQR